MQSVSVNRVAALMEPPPMFDGKMHQLTKLFYEMPKDLQKVFFHQIKNTMEREDSLDSILEKIHHLQQASISAQEGV